MCYTFLVFSLSLRVCCIAVMLAGPIPQLGNLAALQYLDLGTNKLSGEALVARVGGSPPSNPSMTGGA